MVGPLVLRAVVLEHRHNSGQARTLVGCSTFEPNGHNNVSGYAGLDQASPAYLEVRNRHGLDYVNMMPFASKLDTHAARSVIHGLPR